MTLAELGSGQHATVRAVRATGETKRRITDLGLLPGTSVTVALENPLGDPRAYLIRGSLFALRNDQTRLIEVVTEEERNVP